MRRRRLRVGWGLLVLAGVVTVDKLLGAAIPDLVMAAVIGVLAGCIVWWWNG